MTHPAELAKAREALATALLLEYKDGAWTKQQILIPAVKFEGEWTRPLMIQRYIANHSPRKQWRIYRGPSIHFEESVDKENPTLVQFMENMGRQLRYFSIDKHFETAIVNKETRSVPYVLADLSEADIREAKGGKAPAALLRRIQRARVEAGYPEHAYDWSTGTIAGTSGVTYLSATSPATTTTTPSITL